MDTTQIRAGVKEDISLEGLRVPGSFARHPWIGLTMVVSGGIVFAVLAYNLQTKGPLLKWDVPMANHFYNIATNSPELVKKMMIAGFYVGKELLSVIGVSLGVYFGYKRYWRELVMVLLGFGGAGTLWYVLSNVFNRPRPVFESPIWVVINGGGFPSGHTLTAVASYGFLAYLFASNTKSRFIKWVSIGGATAITLFIGYSRLFLGDHYITDILAGYALGVLWSGLVYTGVEMYFNKRSN